MIITSKEVETVVGKELATRLCEWIRLHTPVTCIKAEDDERMGFDIDEAMAFAKIRMHTDALKREFFPHFVKLKQHRVKAQAAPVFSS
jgi:hypothetical protein